MASNGKRRVVAEIVDGRPTTNSERVVVNSHADIVVLQKKEQQQAFDQRRQFLLNAATLVNSYTSDPFVRSQLMRYMVDGPKNIDADCGYPTWLTPLHYSTMYEREGVAKRVVHCEPNESWRVVPEVYEDENPENDTEFEKEWKAFVKRWDPWHWLHRIDQISGIGQFGILLLGLDDGRDLNEPVEGMEEWDGTMDEEGDVLGSGKINLIYIRAFSEEVVWVAVREKDVKSKRYGLPVMYDVQFRDYPSWGISAGEIVSRKIHWTRVIHVADNRVMSEVYGVPRMREVYNRLFDLRKVYAASGEGYWRGAFPGLAFEINPELADQGIEMDKESIRKEFAAYADGLQRYMAVQGVTTKSLPPQVVDPSGTAESLLKSIAIAKEIPYRILFGSEEAKLASGQDSRAWNDRVARRQNTYVTPHLVRPFVDRLVQFGILPPVEEYFVDWPDLNAPTDQDKAGVGLTRTQALASYVGGGVDQLIPPRSFLAIVLGMTTEEIDAIMKDQETYNVPEEPEPGMEEEGEAPPAAGEEQEQPEETEAVEPAAEE